jgi:hypothetical protein
MATAEAYNDYDDPGMAFGEDEVKAYKPELWAEGRVKELVERCKVVAALLALGEDKPVFWKSMAGWLHNVVSWYCRVAELDGVDFDALSTAAVKDKACIAAARKVMSLGADAWVHEWQSEADRHIRYVVTLGRRCATSKTLSGWTKRDRSISNKLANAIMGELRAADKALVTLNSVPRGSISSTKA